MDNQGVVVRQEPDADHPAEVIVDPIDNAFASVFKTLFPEVQCPHCYSQMRLLFLAGVVSTDNTYDCLNKIRSEEHLDGVTKWVQGQVEQARTELDIELKVASAEQNWCYHDEPPAYN